MAFTYNYTVFTLDLKTAFVRFDFGLTLCLMPTSQSFFASSLREDDTSYKLACPTCFARIQMDMPNKSLMCSRVDCRNRGNDLPYYENHVLPIWLPPSGIRLATDKARVRVERSGGNFPVISPEELEEAFANHEFLEDLNNWVAPYTPPLESLMLTFELSSLLNEIWEGWKAAKKHRNKEKKIDAFRKWGEEWSSAPLCESIELLHLPTPEAIEQMLTLPAYASYLHLMPTETLAQEGQK